MNLVFEWDSRKASRRFDYSKSRPNRFAAGAERDVLVVVLDPDVASVFQSWESVNSLLRSVISALPAAGRSGPSRGRRKP
jgi:hypothetical protein